MALVSHWKLDESGNTLVAADSAGSNPGTLTNFPADPTASWIPGKISNALKFAGGSEHIAIAGDPVLFSVTAPWSYSFWLYSDAYNTTHEYIASIKTDNKALLLLLTSSSSWGGFSFGYENLIGGIKCTGVAKNFFLGRWTMVTMTFDGVDANVLSSYKCYIDDSSTTIATQSGLPIETTTTKIGRRTGGAAPDNTQDDIRIYNHTLTAQEVIDLFNAANGASPAAFLPRVTFF